MLSAAKHLSAHRETLRCAQGDNIGTVLGVKVHHRAATPSFRSVIFTLKDDGKHRPVPILLALDPYAPDGSALVVVLLASRSGLNRVCARNQAWLSNGCSPDAGCTRT